MGFRQFGPHILTLEEQANAVRAQEMLRIGKQLGQGGAGPRRDEIEGLHGRILHALVPDMDLEFHGLGSGNQKGAFLGGGLIQSDGNPVP